MSMAWTYAAASVLEKFLVPRKSRVLQNSPSFIIEAKASLNNAKVRRRTNGKCSKEMAEISVL